MRRVLLVLLVLLVGMLAYIRLAPSDPAMWHMPPDFSESADFEGGVVRVAEGNPDTLARLDAIARATPRTNLLAGSVEDGMVTYVTRTAWVGFPDYTTVLLTEGQLILHARLRFGRSDFGVNRDRVEAWLGALQL